MAANRQTDIHTTSANAVMLVWGSLRLAPIDSTVCFCAHILQLVVTAPERVISSLVSDVS